MAESQGAAPGKRISVFVVDDHAVVRQGLRVFLSAVPDVDVVGEAEGGEEALAALRAMAAHRELPDVVLMDIHMPGGPDGIETTAAVRAAHPDVRVVALTTFGDTERAQAAMQAGASGYLLKDAGVEDIVGAVRAAHRNDIHLDAQVARALARSVAVGDPSATLSAREREVLKLVARGRSNQEIADTLVISERTARTHVSHVLGKLGLESRVQAALWAIRHGLVSVSPTDD